MRICVLSDGYPPWDRGGAQKIAAQTATGYHDRGHSVSVVTTVPRRSDTGCDRIEGVPVHRVYTPRPDRWLPYLTVHNPIVSTPVGRLLDRVNPDVVHAHNVHWLSNTVLRLAADRGCPIVKTYHDAGTVSYGELTQFIDDIDPRGSGRVPTRTYRVSPWAQLREQGLRYFPLRNRLNKRALDRYITVGVAVSEELRRALRANRIPCQETIYNGVDVDAFDATTDGAFETEFGPADSAVILFGGRAGGNKGATTLAAAFAELCSWTDRSIRLVITGDDAHLDRIEAAADPYAGRVRSTGWIPGPAFRAGLRSATVVATPSVHLDPFPTINLEAFAAGTPAVTSRFGGARELVDHGIDGAIVDPRDVTALANALRTMVTDPDRARAYGAAGRRKVRRRFTIDRQVEAYLDLFDRVASPG